MRFCQQARPDVEVHSIHLGFSVAHLVACPRGLLLIDAGLPGCDCRILRAIEWLRRDDLKWIFVTHAHVDHYGSVAALRRLTDARIAIHAADAEPMARGETRLGDIRGRGWLMWALFRLVDPLLRPEPVSADRCLTDGGQLTGLGCEAVVVHTPGHTPGSATLVVGQGERRAFVGDLLSATGRPHAQCCFADDWSLIPRSVTRLQGLGPAWTYTGHNRCPITARKLADISP